MALAATRWDVLKTAETCLGRRGSPVRIQSPRPHFAIWGSTGVPARPQLTTNRRSQIVLPSGHVSPIDGDSPHEGTAASVNPGVAAQSTRASARPSFRSNGRRWSSTDLLQRRRALARRPFPADLARDRSGGCDEVLAAPGRPPRGLIRGRYDQAVTTDPRRAPGVEVIHNRFACNRITWKSSALQAVALPQDAF